MEHTSGTSIDELVRSALADVLELIAQPSSVVPLEPSRAAVDCESAVLDFLAHNESAVALEHLIYVVGEADLPITGDTYDTLCTAANLMKIDATKHQGINPRQQPINTLGQLRHVTGQAYTVAIKRLAAGWSVAGEPPGPFPGTHVAELRGDDAMELRNLVDELEPGPEMPWCRPRSSIVCWGPLLPVAEVALCTRCNHAQTRIGSVLGSFRFNGASAPARELLDWMMLFDTA